MRQHRRAPIRRSRRRNSLPEVVPVQQNAPEQRPRRRFTRLRFLYFRGLLLERPLAVPRVDVEHTLADLAD
jgi:hypothetical protein